MLSADGALVGNKKREILSREHLQSLALWQPCLESVRKRTRSSVGVSLQCRLQPTGNIPAHIQRRFCPRKTLCYDITIGFHLQITVQLKCQYSKLEAHRVCSARSTNEI